jgi:predicted MFS family arabinose efflux permease
MPNPPFPSARERWTAALILTVLYTVHSIDRYMIAVVLVPIRKEFHLTDTQLGALGGTAHALAFALFVLPMGWLLDRTSRVKLLALMLAVWSGLTALGALATGYWHLFLVRMGVGGAESASSSGSQSLIASLFPMKERSSAMGVVFSGLAIGTGLAFAAGGAAAQAWGWRSVFLLAGIPGLLLAGFMWLAFKEPPRTHAQDKEVGPAPPMWKVAAFVARNRPILFSVVGLTLATMSSASVWTWTMPVLVRQHGMSLTKAGLIVGTASGLMKFISTAGSGFLADWLARGRIDRLWIVPTCALTLSFPVCVAMAMAPSVWLVTLLVMILGMTMGTHYSAPKAVIVSVAPGHMRGSVAAIEELTLNLIGGGFGPLLTGFLSDRLGGKESAGRALAATLSLNLVAALCFWLSTRSKTAEPAERAAPVIV